MVLLFSTQDDPESRPCSRRRVAEASALNYRPSPSIVTSASFSKT